MRFVGQKDGEDHDPGNVQADFSLLQGRKTFITSAKPDQPWQRQIQAVAKALENLHLTLYALERSRRGFPSTFRFPFEK